MFTEKTPASLPGTVRREFLRRGFLKTGAGLLAAAAAMGSRGEAQQNSGTGERVAKANGRPILLKDGIVLSLDPQVGDFAKADLLIQGKKIMAVGPNLSAPAHALVVNASGMIIMPGFVDTHHHQYETVLRGIIADGMWGSNQDRLPLRNYTSVLQQTFTPLYTPADVRIAELLASLSQINDGVTTTVDTSQVQLTSEHTDAGIAGLKESGRRCLFAYGAGGADGARRNPLELARLRKQYFSSDDQLLTLAMNAAVTPEMFQVARTAGVPTVSHCQGGNFNEPAIIRSGLMGPDHEYIHCTRVSKEMLKAIADTGGKVSLAVAIEMQMGHAYPPLQQCLDLGIRPSLSVDVECNMTSDSFTQMRAAFTWQRALANQRTIEGEKDPPRLLTCREVIEFATIDGAKCAHLDAKIGTLKPGKQADIVMLTTGLNVTPLNNVPGAVVTLMDTSNVDSVFIAGKLMKWQGRLVGVDVNRILQEANKAAEGLIARANYSNSLFDPCCSGPLLRAEQRATASPDQVKRGR